MGHGSRFSVPTDLLILIFTDKLSIRMNDIFYADMIKSLLNQLTFTGENPEETANEIFRLFSIMYLYFHHIFRFWCRQFNNFDYGFLSG